MWKLARDLKLDRWIAFESLCTLSLTSFLSLYKWKFSNAQHHLVVKEYHNESRKLLTEREPAWLLPASVTAQTSVQLSGVNKSKALAWVFMHCLKSPRSYPENYLPSWWAFNWLPIFESVNLIYNNPKLYGKIIRLFRSKQQPVQVWCATEVWSTARARGAVRSQNATRA